MYLRAVNYSPRLGIFIWLKISHTHSLLRLLCRSRWKHGEKVVVLCSHFSLPLWAWLFRGISKDAVCIYRKSVLKLLQLRTVYVCISVCRVSFVQFSPCVSRALVPLIFLGLMCGSCDTDVFALQTWPWCFSLRVLWGYKLHLNYSVFLQVLYLPF